MKNLYFLIVLFGFSCYGQNDLTILIKYPDYKITLFESNYIMSVHDGDTLYCFQSILGRYSDCKPWTPTIAQVMDFDKKVKDLITVYKDTTAMYYKQTDDRKYIISNLNKYNRQYFCCKNKNGERILYIQFYYRLKNDNIDKPDKDMKFALGGGTDYFSLTYNLDLNKLMYLQINSPM